MKKKIMGAIAFIAIAVAAGWNVQQNQNKTEMSDLTLENIEALASGESIEEFCKNCIPTASASSNPASSLTSIALPLCGQRLTPTSDITGWTAASGSAEKTQ